MKEPALDIELNQNNSKESRLAAIEFKPFPGSYERKRGVNGATMLNGELRLCFAKC